MEPLGSRPCLDSAQHGHIPSHQANIPTFVRGLLNCHIHIILYNRRTGGHQKPNVDNIPVCIVHPAITTAAEVVVYNNKHTHQTFENLSSHQMKPPTSYFHNYCSRPQIINKQPSSSKTSCDEGNRVGQLETYCHNAILDRPYNRTLPRLDAPNLLPTTIPP